MIYAVPELQAQLWADYLSRQSEEVREAIAWGESKVLGFSSFAAELFHRFYDAAARPIARPTKPEYLWAKLLHEEIDLNPNYQRAMDTIALESAVAPSQRGEFAGQAALYFVTVLAEKLPEPTRPPVDPQLLRDLVRTRQAQLEEIERCLAQYARDSLSPEGEARRDDLLAVRLTVLDEISEFTHRGEALMEEIKDFYQSFEDTLECFVRACLDGSIARMRQEAEANALLNNLFGDSNGWGFGRGSKRGTGTKLEQSILLQRIERSNRLQRLAELAGKMHLRARRAQAKREASVEEPALNLGDDLASVLPIELARAGDAELAGTFLLDYSERSLRQVTPPPAGKGPLVICLDSSGTMEGGGGKREIWAKAVTLALLNIARVENREVSVVHFDDGPRQIDTFSGKYDPMKVLDTMETSYGGGTEWMATLDAATGLIASPQADIAFITDGRAAVSEEWLASFKQRQQAMGFKVYGILVDLIEDTLDPICDLVVKVADLTEDAELEPIWAI